MATRDEEKMNEFWSKEDDARVESLVRRFKEQLRQHKEQEAIPAEQLERWVTMVSGHSRDNLHPTKPYLKKALTRLEQENYIESAEQFDTGMVKLGAGPAVPEPEYAGEFAKARAKAERRKNAEEAAEKVQKRQEEGHSSTGDSYHDSGKSRQERIEVIKTQLKAALASGNVVTPKWSDIRQKARQRCNINSKQGEEDIEEAIEQLVREGGVFKTKNYEGGAKGAAELDPLLRKNSAEHLKEANDDLDDDLTIR